MYAVQSHVVRTSLTNPRVNSFCSLDAVIEKKQGISDKPLRCCFTEIIWLQGR